MMSLKQPNKTKKSKGLTTSQWEAWVHAHYVVHHDTAADALQFLKDKRKLDNTASYRYARRYQEDVTSQTVNLGKGESWCLW